MSDSTKFIYIQTELNLWTVGHYDPKDGKFIPESDHSTPQKAGRRVIELNGGRVGDYTTDEILKAVHGLWSSLDLSDFLEMFDIEDDTHKLNGSQAKKHWKHWQEKPLSFIMSRDLAYYNMAINAIEQRAEIIKNQ